MIKVRSGVFETNSSSTHSLAIPKVIDKEPEIIVFIARNFGWEEGTYNACDYIYTYIICGILNDLYCETDDNSSNEEIRITKEIIESNDYIERIEKVLSKHGIKCYFEIPKYSSRGDWYDVGIDHKSNFSETFDTIMNNEDLLYRCLVGGIVYTGNDNENDEQDMCYCAFPTMMVYNESTGLYEHVPNPNHDEEKYGYFYKGN